MQRSFHGALAALLTPRKSDGTIDEAGFARNIDFILEHGGTGVVVAGGTGEYAAFSMAERKALFAQAVTANRGRGGTHSRTDSSLQFGGVL
jgi:4-hydroxy-tetrahydrodipicolinate synthase